ncbi:DUF3566 domain-containing protein [Calidifontibacter indicus]|uniref:DUF3566 domain-containing protein n=1 Tax=Calidifontibacter indicus TaxID=419650 RepID=UPI003D75FD32
MSTPTGSGKSQAEAAKLPAGASRPANRPSTSGQRRPAPAGAARRPATGQRPAARPGQRPARATPRRVRLTVSRVDPFSVFKVSFLLSVAVGIATVVMVGVLWTVLAGMGVFDNLNELLRTLDREGSNFNLMDYIGFGKVLSLSVLIGVIDVILMTAIATLMAFLYNICASLVGGLQLTLTDD